MSGSVAVEVVVIYTISFLFCLDAWFSQPLNDSFKETLQVSGLPSSVRMNSGKFSQHLSSMSCS